VPNSPKCFGVSATSAITGEAARQMDCAGVGGVGKVTRSIEAVTGSSTSR
jgi:hypothetical protein